jgi:type II secretory pathway pseudopilin PulG
MFPQCDTERGARRNRRADGFSLVETALAMAIVCFAFIPLLGLLPIGVSTMREAKDDIVAARIVQQIGNEAQQADFEALVSTGSLRYFDDQSRELPASQREASGGPQSGDCGNAEGTNPAGRRNNLVPRQQPAGRNPQPAAGEEFQHCGELSPLPVSCRPLCRTVPRP